MNLIIETKRKLEYQRSRIKELQGCLSESISLDAQKYIKDEITKSEKSLEYYSLILEKLEG